MEGVELLEACLCHCDDEAAVGCVEEGFVIVSRVICDFEHSGGCGVEVRVDWFCGECGVSRVSALWLLRGDAWGCADFFA